MHIAQITASLFAVVVAALMVSKWVQPHNTANKCATYKAERSTLETAKLHVRGPHQQSPCNYASAAQLGRQGKRSVFELAKQLERGTNDMDRQQAAEELARIGTPSAVKALLQALATLPDGDLKEEVAHLAAGITGHKTARALLETLAASSDPTVLRAAQSALSQIADSDIIREISTRYETSVNKEEKTHLVNILAYAQNSDAVDALMNLASQRVGGTNAALADAAIRGLANIGTGPAVSFLVQQFEAMSPEQAGLVFEVLSKMSSPEAHAALLYAAQGNKEATTEQSRTAAILALANYQDEQTSNLLGRLASADDPAISAAAQTSLQTMGQMPAMP